MDAGKILYELTYAEGLPREALKAASAQRGEMLPLFIEEIETYLALETAARAMPTPLFFMPPNGVGRCRLFSEFTQTIPASTACAIRSALPESAVQIYAVRP